MRANNPLAALALGLVLGCAGPPNLYGEDPGGFGSPVGPGSPNGPPVGGPPPVEGTGGGPIGGTGGTGGSTTTPSSARSLFDANVAPILMGSCGGGGCHAISSTATQVPFVTASSTDLYGAVLAQGDKLLSGNFNKATAQILTEIQGGHYVTYTTQAVAAISQWLDGEVTARAGTTTGPSISRQLMSEWSGCMSLTDWDAEEVAQLWADKGSNQGDCEQCHVNGQGFLANRDSERMFNILTTLANPTQPGSMFMEYYFIPDLTTDPSNPKMVLNLNQITNAGTGKVAQHPLYSVSSSDEAIQALQRFHSKTLARLAAGTCDAPRFNP